MILLIDNYDSFSFNLYQMVGELCPNIRVVRNDELSVEEVRALAPEAIILSPGPGRPASAGICVEVVRQLSGTFPILGVCLGHQAICEAFGATVTYAKTLMHGKQSTCSEVAADPIFALCEEPLKVARYHSLAADPSTIPAALEVLARTDDGEVMAVRVAGEQTYGLQFHPESILTPQGAQILKAFLTIANVELEENHD